MLLGALLLEVDSLALLHALTERLVRSAGSVRGRLLLGEGRLADGSVLRLQDLSRVARRCACGGGLAVAHAHQGSGVWVEDSTSICGLLLGESNGGLELPTLLFPRLLRHPFLLGCGVGLGLLWERLWRRRSVERPKLCDKLLETSHSHWRLLLRSTVKVSHSLRVLASITRAFLHDLPADTVILCRARMVLECLDSVVESIDDVLGSTLGRVAVRPGVFWERVVGARGEDGGERFRAGWRRNLGGEGEGSVQGEEGRDVEICHGC